MIDDPAHVFCTQPPNPYCPKDAAYSLHCEHCGASRGILVPCLVDDFVAQLEEFMAKHAGCKLKEPVA